MSMVINTNMASLNAQRILDKTSQDQGTAMERLTSGLRINKAADDAAGLAVATGMTTQIRGTDQALRNANDGVSMIQTIDGSAEEATNILQRMRELGVQSLNETYNDTNRLQMNEEFKQLKSEIDRIAETTKFNGQQVLAEQKAVDIHAGWETTINDKITINTINMSASALGGSVDTGAVLVSAPTGNFSAAAAEDGYALTIGATFAGANDSLAAAQDFTVTYGEEVNGVTVLTAKQANEAMAFKINSSDELADAGIYAQLDKTDGSFTLVSSVEGNLVNTDVAAAAAGNDVTLAVDDTVDNFKVAGLDLLDVTTVNNAKVAVDSIDVALGTISEYRSQIGALQNRMEYTISNLSNVNENMNAARSAIEDADFARESSNLARTQVLQQAGMSMLSQANQNSQNVLSLLR
ncbi:MAG: flagellin [Methyloprofundus sp.]|nr:flagellin [Methyloprofundus sp.]